MKIRFILASVQLHSMRLLCYEDELLPYIRANVERSLITIPDHGGILHFG